MIHEGNGNYSSEHHGWNNLIRCVWERMRLNTNTLAWIKWIYTWWRSYVFSICKTRIKKFMLYALSPSQNMPRVRRRRRTKRNFSWIHLQFSETFFCVKSENEKFCVRRALDDDDGVGLGKFSFLSHANWKLFHIYTTKWVLENSR